jgi:hypothetical protein
MSVGAPYSSAWAGQPWRALPAVLSLPLSLGPSRASARRVLASPTGPRNSCPLLPTVQADSEARYASIKVGRGQPRRERLWIVGWGRYLIRGWSGRSLVGAIDPAWPRCRCRVQLYLSRQGCVLSGIRWESTMRFNVVCDMSTSIRPYIITDRPSTASGCGRRQDPVRVADLRSGAFRQGEAWSAVSQTPHMHRACC